CAAKRRLGRQLSALGELRTQAVVTHSQNQPDRSRPYPKEWERRLLLPDKTHIFVRPVRPDDDELFRDFAKGVSEAINKNGAYIDMVGVTGSIPVARAAVSAAKNPVPGAEKVWCRELRLEAVAAGCALPLKSVNVKKWNQGWARPSRSNCSDHSAGASRKVATPMPRGPCWRVG